MLMRVWLSELLGIFMIERKISVPVYLTPEELAFEFSNMDDTGQAEFFNCLHNMTEKWERPLCFQLQYVTDNIVLTDGGRMVMEQIGDYAKPSAA